LTKQLGSRAAFAIALCCGFGCGDDPAPEKRQDAAAVEEEEPAPAEADAKPDDADPGSDEADADVETPAPDAASSGADAGTLVRADAGSARADVDTSSARLSGVATDFCKVAFQCDQTMARRVWGNETFCQREVQGLWQNDLDFNGADCADAQLDLHRCYAAASCADQLTTCVAEEDDVTALCPPI
jgi:hypothetical protein